MTLKHGSKAHRAHMSRVMKESWARRRPARLKSLTEYRNERTKPIRIVHFAANKKAAAIPSSTTNSTTRLVAFNYCPNCGEHLAKFYPYE